MYISYMVTKNKYIEIWLFAQIAQSYISCTLICQCRFNTGEAIVTWADESWRGGRRSAAACCGRTAPRTRRWGPGRPGTEGSPRTAAKPELHRHLPGPCGTWWPCCPWLKGRRPTTPRLKAGRTSLAQHWRFLPVQDQKHGKNDVMFFF